MILYHTTTRTALASIMKEGIDPARSTQGMRASWFHGASRTAWAVSHCTRRRAARPEEMVTLRVRIPRSWLRRHAKGIWYTGRIVLPCRILSATGYAPVSVAL